MKPASFAVAAQLILLFAIFTFAQDAAIFPGTAEAEQPKATTKIDEFGRVSDCDLSARIQSFYIQLANSPDAGGYVLVYRDADVLPSGFESNAMLNRIKQHIQFLRLNEARVVFVDGGYRKSVETEFWLVPPGFTAPEPTETVEKPTMPTDKTFLWGQTWVGTENEDDPTAEFVLPSVKEKLELEARLAEQEAAEMDQATEETQPTSADESDDTAQAAEQPEEVDSEPEPQPSAEEIQAARFDWADERFGKEIARRDKARGVLIFYADDKYYDVQKVKEFVKEGRDRIVSESGLDPKSIKVVFGGYRESIEAEFWIVPPKGKSPKATPSERSKDDTSAEQ